MPQHSRKAGSGIFLARGGSLSSVLGEITGKNAFSIDVALPREQQRWAALGQEGELGKEKRIKEQLPTPALMLFPSGCRQRWADEMETADPSALVQRGQIEL